MSGTHVRSIAQKLREKCSISKLIFRNIARLDAFGFEIVCDFVGAVGPHFRRNSEFDQSESWAESDEAQIAIIIMSRIEKGARTATDE